MRVTALALVLDALAVYRLTRLITEDTFPPVRRFREAVIRRYTAVVAQGPGTVEDPGWQAELIQCPWCASVWLAAGVTAARWVLPSAWSFVAWLLALSAVASIVSQFVDGED